MKRTLHKRKGNRQPEEETDEQERILCCLPYIKGRPLKVRIVHKAPTTLRSLLTRVKPPTPKDQATGVIYQIPCECGDNYIGETSKTFNERLKEHKRAVRRMDNNNSVAVHVRDTGHNISWENAKIMLKEENKMRRKIKEAIKIKTIPCFNMDQGIYLDPIWINTCNSFLSSINIRHTFSLHHFFTPANQLLFKHQPFLTFSYC